MDDRRIELYLKKSVLFGEPKPISIICSKADKEIKMNTTEKVLNNEMAEKMVTQFAIDQKTGLVEHKQDALHNHFVGPAGQHYSVHTPVYVPGVEKRR
jgi:hypothetical protein